MPPPSGPFNPIGLQQVSRFTEVYVKVPASASTINYFIVAGTTTIGMDSTGGGTLTVVNLPSSGTATEGDRIIVRDEGGGAATHNIRIFSDDADTIHGASVINTNNGYIEYYYDGALGWWQIRSDASGGGMTIGSPVSGAAANGLLYVDGSGNLGQDAYVNLSASVLTIGGSGAFGGLVIVDTSGNDVFRFETGIAKFGTPNGSTMIGDPFGVGFNSIFEVDDANQKTTCNVKHETSGDITITNSAKGLVLKDTAGTPHYWRLSVSTLGVITATDIGTSPP